MNYKDKDDGTIKTMQEVRTEWNNLVSNSDAFEEYRDDFHKFVRDYYDEE